MPVRAVRARHLTAVVDDLHDAGLSPRRETAVVGALHSLYAFAVARGLVRPTRCRTRAPAPAPADARSAPPRRRRPRRATPT